MSLIHMVPLGPCQPTSSVGSIVSVLGDGSLGVYQRGLSEKQAAKGTSQGRIVSH